MTCFIIKETVVREVKHPAYIDEWFCGKNGWCGEATLPQKYVAIEYGWSARGWAERRIEEMKLSDAHMKKMYPDTPYTKNYEILEVAV